MEKPTPYTWKDFIHIMAVSESVAHEVAEMGYDPLKAIEALPTLIAMIASLSTGGDFSTLDRDRFNERDLLARIKDTDNE